MLRPCLFSLWSQHRQLKVVSICQDSPPILWVNKLDRFTLSDTGALCPYPFIFSSVLGLKKAYMMAAKMLLLTLQDSRNQWQKSVSTSLFGLWVKSQFVLRSHEYQILRMFWECCTYTKYQHWPGTSYDHSSLKHSSKLLAKLNFSGTQLSMV